MKRTQSAIAARAITTCVAMTAAAVAAAQNISPLTVGPLCLRQPRQELVQFSGALIYGVTGGGPVPIVYAGGPIGLVAGVITQSAIEKHKQSKEKQDWRDSADRVLEPYRPVLNDFTHAELMRQALELLVTDGSKTLLKFTDPAGAGLQIESAPIYYMTHDARTVVLENALLIRSPGANPKVAPLFKSVVKIVGAPRARTAPEEQDSWISNRGAELRAIAIEEFRASLDLALTEIARGSDTAPREFRNVHYFESDIPKMEHAQVIADLPDHIVFKTLRGWIMSVPVGPARSEQPTELQSQ